MSGFFGAIFYSTTDTEIEKAVTKTCHYGTPEITLTVHFIQQERAALFQQIANIETQMSGTMEHEEFTNVKKAYDDKMIPFRKNIEIRKRSKLEQGREVCANNHM